MVKYRIYLQYIADDACYEKYNEIKLQFYLNKYFSYASKSFRLKTLTSVAWIRSTYEIRAGTNFTSGVIRTSEIASVTFFNRNTWWFFRRSVISIWKAKKMAKYNELSINLAKYPGQILHCKMWWCICSPLQTHSWLSLSIFLHLVLGFRSQVVLDLAHAFAAVGLHLFDKGPCFSQYGALHTHSYEPSLFLHSAFSGHEDALLHSLISSQLFRSPGRVINRKIDSLRNKLISLSIQT